MKILIILISFFLLGCGISGDTIKKEIREGMTRQEVVDILGPPDGFRKSGQIEYLRYLNVPLSNSLAKGSADYVIILDQNKVQAYDIETYQRPYSGSQQHSIFLWTLPQF